MDDYPTLDPPFSALAAVYDRAGLAQYAADAIGRYVTFALQNDWVGRRVIDIGCRTGITSQWLHEQGYRVTATEESPALLQAAATRFAGYESAIDPPEFVQCPLSDLGRLPGPVDLALAIDGIFNAAGSLRDLETIFRGVHAVLDTDRPLIFDMETIGGLAASAQAPVTVLYDDPRELTVIARARFSFEALCRTTHYTIWRLTDAGWQRSDEHHLARGYPVQAVRSMLERAGFALHALLSPDMQPLDPGHEHPARVVFIAHKQNAGAP